MPKKPRRGKLKARGTMSKVEPSKGVADNTPPDQTFGGGGPDPFGHPPGAPLDISKSYAPPHFLGGVLNTQALNTMLGPATRLLGGLDDPVAPDEKKTAPDPALTPPPSAGTSPIFHGGQPPQLDPASLTRQMTVQGSLVVREGESLTVTGESSHLFDKSIVTLHVRGLIEAFQEVEDYHPLKNEPRPALWKDDKDYLDDIKALVAELRRLNALLERREPPKAEEIAKNTAEIVHAARKITDEAYGVIGKGLGAIILTSIGALVVQLGAPELGQILMSAIKDGK